MLTNTLRLVMRASACRFALVVGTALIGLPCLAHADDQTKGAQIDDQTKSLQLKIDTLQHQLDSMKDKIDSVKAAPTEDSAKILKRYMAGETNLTMMGVTLYGTIDMGLSYQNHGAPLNDFLYLGSNEMLQKNSTRTVWGMTPSGLSQSKVGLKFYEPVIENQLNLVGKLETGFNPQSGQLSDAVKSVQMNNGQSLYNQTANADGSRAGQFFNSEAYVGVNSPTYGELVAGRVNDIFNDNVGMYDPMGGSYAFSPIGYSGFMAGAGNTENTRLNDALKYNVKVGPVRMTALAQVNTYQNQSLGAYQFDVGTNAGGLSLDAAFSKINDSIHVGSTTVGCPTNTLGVSDCSYLNANVSDNTAEQLLAKYATGPVTGYLGYEHVNYANPSNAVPTGSSTIGGYLLHTNNAAFTNNQILNVFWTGAKYMISPKWSVTGAGYVELQNDWSAHHCGSSSSCANGAGTAYWTSIMTDYNLTRRFDVYGGIMYNHYLGGLSNGYAYNSAYSPMVGGRFNF